LKGVWNGSCEKVVGEIIGTVCMSVFVLIAKQRFELLVVQIYFPDFQVTPTKRGNCVTFEEANDGKLGIRKVCRK
jgi:hypothetical protein